MKSLVIGVHATRADVEPVARAIAAHDLFLSAVDVEDDQPLGDRELLVRVARTRGELLGRATFIAIRYGFALTSDGDAPRRIEAHAAQWKRLLSAHREHVEMTLKTAAVAPRPRPDRRDFSSGADYLRALHGATHAASADPAFVAAANEMLAPLAIRHRWLHRDEKSVELAALVPRASLDAVARAGEALRERCPGVPFLLSGPWPLEVFADDDHE